MKKGVESKNSSENSTMKKYHTNAIIIIFSTLIAKKIKKVCQPRSNSSDSKEKSK